jgi:polyvinyl alcohol dehydrogenase (cytochrome)
MPQKTMFPEGSGSMRRLHSLPASMFVALAGAMALSMAACSSDDRDGKDGDEMSGTGGANGTGGGGGGGGAPPSGNTDWTMLGYDAQSTFNNTAETKISRDSVAGLTEAFTIDLGGPINGAPLQVGGVLYAGSGSNQNVAIDLESGTELWRNVDLLVSAAFAYHDGILFAHDFGGVLHALDPSDGHDLWNAPTTSQGSIGFSSPIIADDKIYIGGSNAQELIPGTAPTFRGFVFASNIADGSEVWNAFMVPEDANGAAVWSSPTVDVDTGEVFAGTGNNYTEPATDSSDAIIAIDDTGTIKWKNQRYAGDIFSFYATSQGITNPDYDFGANPTLFEAEVDGTMTKLVAAGQKSGDFHVLKRADGAEVCKRNLGPGSLNGSRGIFNNGAWDGTHLLVAANGATSDAPGSEPSDSAFGQSVLFAIDPATCDVAWERQLRGPVMGPITVANGVGFVGADRHLEAFNTDTGQRLFSYDAPSTIACAPTVSDGRVAFGTGINWSVGTTGTMLVVLSL